LEGIITTGTIAALAVLEPCAAVGRPGGRIGVQRLDTEEVMNTLGNSRRGVTLTELLVVLVIVAILATIAVPVYLNRVETARYRTAQAETRELAQAMEICGAIHGMYVPLQMLDDVATVQALRDVYTDDLANEPQTLYLFDVAIPPLQQLSPNQPQLRDGLVGATNYNQKVADMISQWQGPFVNFNRFFMGWDSANNAQIRSVVDSSSEQVSRDFPLDPWGQPYRLFSPLGITGQTAWDGNTPSSPQEWDTDGKFDMFLSNLSGDQDPYDRWAIVSFGPNRVADSFTNVNEADDIVHFFGYVATETRYVR